MELTMISNANQLGEIVDSSSTKINRVYEFNCIIT